jgi:hypothetical protein
VTIAVRPVASIPFVTCSAVELPENPDNPFLLNGHMIMIISLSLLKQSQLRSARK